MASNKLTFEMILSAVERGVVSTFTKTGRAMHAFNKRARDGIKIMSGLERAAVAVAGAWVGLESIAGTVQIVKDAEQAGFNLESSVKAANREFDNVGSIEQWRSTIGGLSDELKVYSKAALQNATSRTIDMTKRLGLSADQMQVVLKRTADLSAGKTTLEDGIERVTAALRGEAEASEFLALTLNETYVRSWYEASGAMQGAWKDLDDMQKAQIRYQVFLEQSESVLGRAAESVKTFGGALELMKASLHDSIAENDSVVESLKAVATAITENSDELASLAAGLATVVAKMIEFVTKNQDLVKWLAGGAGLAWALGKVVGLLQAFKATLLGFDAAFVVFTGSRLIPWLAIFETSLIAGQGAALALLGTILRLSAGLGALFVGYKVGEWLTMRSAVKGTAEATKELERNSALVSDRLAEISSATGVTVSSMEELDAAVESGKIHYDELTGVWKAGAAGMTAATKKAAEAQKNAQVKSLDVIKKEYKKYADTIKKIQDQIAGREQSLAEQLREMARTGMSDLGAWEDRKKEAEEYEQAARKAAEAGDFDKAVQLADKAKDAYADLNEEVKAGDRVLISQQQALETASAGVQRAGELAIDILGRQKDAAAAAADELNRQQGWQLGEVFTEAGQQAKELNQVIQESGGDWGKVWEKMERDAKAAIDITEQRIVKMTRDRDMTVYVNEVIRRAVGGMIQRFATGGKLGGYGGGDRIHALLEAGEFVIRKEAVKKFGAGIFHALNSLQLPDLPKFATGGPVSMTAGTGAANGGEMTLNLALPGGVSVPTRIDRGHLQELQRALYQYNMSLS